MILWTDVVEVFVITALVSYLIMPLLIKMALVVGYLDHPKDTKIHAKPTPLLGGVGIYIAFMIGLCTAVNPLTDVRLLGVIIGSSLLLVVGLIDDRFGMIPEIKLLAQFLAAMAIIKAGVRMEFLQQYYVNMIITYIWIVGITNAFNLLDNMNGLSAGIGFIASIFFGIIMWTTHQQEMAVLSFAIGGASIGFLKHNFPRARIFMGDSGSLVIGFVLASIAILGSWSSRFLTTSLAMPILILAYPIFDTTLVTIIRIKEGRSIFQGGKDHSSHRLALLGLRRRNAVLMIYGICITLGISALFVQRLSLKAAMSVIAAVALSLIALGIRLATVGRKRVSG